VEKRIVTIMAAIHIGSMEIAMGFADIVMVGGMEQWSI
jgi:acetyl-CoA acetyltransferase